MNDAVTLDVADGVATLTLNRPDVLNAIDQAMIDGLHDALAHVRADDSVRAVVLTGAGRGFCAGADLASMTPGGPPAEVGRLLRDRYNPVVLGMRECPKPIVVAVNGVAAGAGMSFALAGDIVLAARSATFVQAFVRIGLAPDAGSTWLLPRCVGEARARAIAMLAERIDAEAAVRCGMVWQVHADDELAVAAHAMASHLATQPTRALGLIKQAFNASAGNTLVAQLDFEADIQTQAAMTDDFREGVSAFLEKRTPHFSGR